MGAARTADPPQSSRWAAADLSVTAHRRCDLLSAAHRSTVAAAAPRVSLAWCRLLPLCPVARGWHLGARHSGAAGELPPHNGPFAPTDSGNHRQPIGQDYRDGGTTRIRW